jgi:hypothetical protein
MTEVSFDQHFEQQFTDFDFTHELGYASLRSTAIVGLHDFDKGSPIWITLGTKVEGSSDLATVGRIAGRVVEPDLGTIDIYHNHDFTIDLLKPYDRIGLAVQVPSEQNNTRQQIHPTRIAGKGRFAFYLPQDVTREQTGSLFIEKEKLHLTDALYSNAQVNKTVIFDFTHPSDRVA